MIQLHTGDTVWTVNVYWGRHDEPVVFIRKAIVICAENKILRQTWESGYETVIVLDEHNLLVTGVCSTEAEAWQRAAALLSTGAQALVAKAEECSQKAAACVVGQAVPS